MSFFCRMVSQQHEVQHSGAELHIFDIKDKKKTESRFLYYLLKLSFFSKSGNLFHSLINKNNTTDADMVSAMG